MSRQINVVVIDDSAFMRKSLSLMLESDPDIKVVATGRNGLDGLEQIRAHRPDVVTLDVEMPGMNGLETLRVIMQEMPLPVLMVSSVTTEGAAATMEALHLGAVDFLSKELSYVSVNIVNIKDELITKVKAIATSRSLRQRFRLARSRRLNRNTAEHLTQTGFLSSPLEKKHYEAVLIGISTGGPVALFHMIPALPSEFPVPIVIVQHMPAHFTNSMAERINSASQLQVKEAESGEALEKGKVLIAPGGRHLIFSRSNGTLHALVTDQPADMPYRPSVDIMMTSAAYEARQPLLGVIMTGMGKDGVRGLAEVKKHGGSVIAQDEDSSVVFGMPRSAIEEGLVDTIAPLDQIAGHLIAATCCPQG